MVYQGKSGQRRLEGLTCLTPQSKVDTFSGLCFTILFPFPFVLVFIFSWTQRLSDLLVVDWRPAISLQRAITKRNTKLVLFDFFDLLNVNFKTCYQCTW